MAGHSGFFSKRRIFISKAHLPRLKNINRSACSASSRRDSQTQKVPSFKGLSGPNFKEDRRDSSKSKVMRLFEKSSECPNALARLLLVDFLVGSCDGMPAFIQEMSAKI